MSLIKIKDLKKVYDVKNKKINALNGINLDILEGDFFALLGPNGAGKTTTIGILTSLVNKTSGKVFVGGYDIDSNFLDVKKKIGIVGQEFNFNIFENVEDIIVQQAGFYGLNKSDIKQNLKFLLTSLNLEDKKNLTANTLSGGMKRRLMIARALIHNPKILILDEPTAGVDVELRHTMWKFLKKLNKEKKTTIILTTHYLEEAEELCNKIAIINKGKIIENTTMKDLKKKYKNKKLEKIYLDMIGKS